MDAITPDFEAQPIALMQAVSGQVILASLSIQGLVEVGGPAIDVIGY